MAKEDFCFTYYDGDAARDKSHLDRLQRGAYDDIISAQRKFGHLTLEIIKRVLGADFDHCWPPIEWILKKDAAGKFFIEWLENSIAKSRAHAKKQKERIDEYWAKKRKKTNHGNSTEQHRNYHGTSTDVPLENEDEDGYDTVDEFKEGGSGETIGSEFVVPQMAEKFSELFPKYPVDRFIDLPALTEIGGKIAKWLGCTGDFTRPINRGAVLQRWGELITHVAADSHLRRYSLTQINKHFQSVVQSFNNGSKQPKSGQSGSYRPVITGTAESAGSF